MKKKPLPDCINPSSQQKPYELVNEQVILLRRRRLMRQVQKEIFKEFQSLLSKSNLGTQISPFAFKFLEKKLRSRGTRGPFAKVIHDYIVYCAQRDGVPIRTDFPSVVFDYQIGFLAEAVMAVLYLDNQILDGKAGITNQQAISDNVLESRFLLRQLKNNYINSLEHLTLAEQALMKEYIEDIIEVVSIGQYLEKKHGTFKEFKKNDFDSNPTSIGSFESQIPYELLDTIWQILEKEKLPHLHRAFVYEYMKRVYLCSAALFVKTVELIMRFLEYEGEEKENILKFSAYYGIILQFVNDNNDYLPFSTTEKTAEDIFSDVRNETMSLPLIYYFGRVNVKHGIKSLRDKVAESPDKLIRKMHTSLIQYSIPVTQRISLKAIEFIDETFPDWDILEDMLKIGENNKYNQSYNQNKKTRNDYEHKNHRKRGKKL